MFSVQRQLFLHVLDENKLKEYLNIQKWTNRTMVFYCHGKSMNIWVGMKTYSALYMLYSKSLNEVFNMEGAWYVAHYVSYYYLTPPPPLRWTFTTLSATRARTGQLYDVNPGNRYQYTDRISHWNTHVCSNYVDHCMKYVWLRNFLHWENYCE